MSILDDIVAHKQTLLAELPESEVSVQSLREAIERRGGVRDFIGALEQPRSGDVGLIAEIKKASPSAGIIREDFDPLAIAHEFEVSGASCLSVLTDEKYFRGSLDFLKAIRDEVQLPLLRKDFIIDERQIAEAIEWGADAVLLIVAILDDTQLANLHELATAAGLAALVEVHDEAELLRAAAVRPRLIGVNNRNLNDFTVDLGTTERLAGQMDLRETLLVAESGIYSRADVEQLTAAGARAILVGESLMREADIGAKVRELGGQS